MDMCWGHYKAVLLELLLISMQCCSLTLHLMNMQSRSLTCCAVTDCYCLHRALKCKRLTAVWPVKLLDGCLACIQRGASINAPALHEHLLTAAVPLVNLSAQQQQ